MSELVGICQGGAGFWFPADSTENRCPEPRCGCEPQFFIPASAAEALAQAVEGIATVECIEVQFGQKPCSESGYGPGSEDRCPRCQARDALASYRQATGGGE